MKRILLISLILIYTFLLYSQQTSFLVLGDIHYDLIEDHDIEWLQKKPDDLRQVTKEYTQITKYMWPQFSLRLKDKINNYQPEIKVVLQLGDLSEGLAGSEEKADQMARSVVKAVEDVGLNIPWVIIKGNHDITGPGAIDAFNKHYIPMFQKQLNNPKIISANYTYLIDKNLFVCCDPWDKNTDMLDFLEKELSSSNARNKFVMIHEPVIPVNERGWHVYRKEPQKRERLLKILAQNKAVVLCAHLHLYSVIKRDTEYGPIVQIMVNSVVKDEKQLTPHNVITNYSSQIAKDNPDWQPNTLSERIQWLDKETPYVKYFKQAELPGYGILKIDNKTATIIFEYYAGFGKTFYDRVSVSELLK